MTDPPSDILQIVYRNILFGDSTAASAIVPSAAIAAAFADSAIVPSPAFAADVVALVGVAFAAKID